MTEFVIASNHEGEMKHKAKGRKVKSHSRKVKKPGPKPSFTEYAKAREAETKASLPAGWLPDEIKAESNQAASALPIYTMAEVDQLTARARQDGAEAAHRTMRGYVQRDRVKQFVADVENTPRVVKHGSLTVTIETARAVVQELRFRGFIGHDDD
jgi:hypothetical protein